MAEVFSLHKGELTKVQVEGFHSEDELVALIEKYPEIIPSKEIVGEETADDFSLHFMVLKREAGVAPGSIDLLLLDNQAIPTVIEAKLHANREIRRTVIGQGLEYVADLVTKTAQDLLEIVGTDSFDLTPVRDYIDEQEDEETFMTQLNNNLSQGAIRLIILADELPQETRKVIEFLNSYSNLMVFGMEVKQIIADNERRIIIVDLVGPSEKDRAQKTTNQRARKPSYTDCLVCVKEMVLSHLERKDLFSPAYVTARPTRLLDFLLIPPNPQGGDRWAGDLGYTVSIHEGEWRVGFKLCPTKKGGYQVKTERIYNILLQHKEAIDRTLSNPMWQESSMRRGIYDPWVPWGCSREEMADVLAPRIADRLLKWIEVIQPIIRAELSDDAV